MKRKPSEGATLTKSKKQRRQQEKQALDHSKPSRNTESGPAASVNVDQLLWRKVSRLDPLDDFEGFLELEEVEDVEIRRHDEDGRVSYRPLTSAKPATHHPKSGAIAGQILNYRQRGTRTSSSPDLSVADEDEEWQGLASNGSAPTDRENSSQAQPNDQRNDENLAVTPGFFNVLNGHESDHETDVSAWVSLNLSPETLTAIAGLGFSTPTPIQSAAIPEVLAGHDVIGKASTGSGKTLAYAIPLLEHHLRAVQVKLTAAGKIPSGARPAFALILSPTRELAHQITTHLNSLFSSAPIEGPRIATVTGGLSVQKQRRLISNADVIVGTPGRLWEVMSEDKNLMMSLRKIDYIIVDEADRLLSEGHFDEVGEILTALDKRDETEYHSDDTVRACNADCRQTLVFSATFHEGLQQKLRGKAAFGGDLLGTDKSLEYLLRKLNFREPRPKFVDVSPVAHMAEGLKEGLVECAATEKDLFLYALLMYHPNKRTLIFTNSVSAVRRLTPFLQNLNLKVSALHSHMPQKARLRSVERFSSQKQSILIATDVAARGLDIPGVQLVIHYHLPRTADMYVHRSGRTARANHTGSSVLICSPEEVVGVRRLIAKVHASDQSGKSGYFIRSLNVDRRIIARLKPRVSLAKRIADAAIAKEKKSHEDDWLRAGAEDLGVDYDSEEFEAAATGRRGRGNVRRVAERQARSLGKGELQALKAELNELLAHRTNVGVSERYLTSGGFDVNALLAARNGGDFLGPLAELGLEDDNVDN